MNIDLTCPAELWQIELPQQETHVCRLMLYNLGREIITSVEVSMTLLNNDGEEAERLVYRAHDLDGRPETAFQMLIPMEWKAEVSRAEVLIDKVWFDNNSIWRHDKANLRTYHRNALPVGPELERLKFVAGPSAVGYPNEQNGLWVCVCGRANAENEKTCKRCHRSREQVFQDYSEEAVAQQHSLREAQLKLQAKAAREDASRLQLQREQAFERKRKRRRRVLTWVGGTAAAAALVYVGVYHVAPYVRYRVALHDLQQGRYAQAQMAFAAMGDYLDAPMRQKQAIFEQTVQGMETADEAALVAARQTLLSLGDYEGAADQALEADYRRAVLMMQNERPAEAAALFDALGDYRDSKDQRRACHLAMAEQLFAAGDYDAARTAFLAIGGADAEERAQDALFASAQASLDAGAPQTALDKLVTLGVYPGAEELSAQSHIALGDQLLQAGERAKAGDAYLLAGAYGDAAEKAGAVFYALANEAEENGDLQAAYEAYARVPSYSDAATRRAAVTLAMAQRAIKDKEYPRALTLLAELEKDETVAALQQEASYLQAVADLADQRFEAAATAFAALDGYRDSADLLLQARYHLAAQKTEEADFAAAAGLYEALGDYEDSAALLQAARLAWANSLLDSGSYSDAIKLYDLLGDAAAVTAKRNEATLGLAAQTLAAGDIAAARKLYASLGEADGAKAGLQACDYALAAQTTDPEQAAALYEAAGDYLDAADQAAAIRYTQGKQADEAGQTLLAARAYHKAGGYQDAATLSDDAYDRYYGTVAEQARTAMQNNQYDVAVALLQHTDLTELPKRYADLKEIWTQANYNEAQQLYQEGKPYRALPYYQAVKDLPGVRARLNSSTYQIIGSWQAAEGDMYSFRTDGTCTLAGEEAYFFADMYQLRTGASADDLSLSYKISSIAGDRMTLRDVRGNRNRTMQLVRLKDEPATATDLAEHTFRVVEDEQP